MSGDIFGGIFGSLFAPPDVLPNTDCRDGKHQACAGDGWDTARDEPTDCPCWCHIGGGRAR